jgi:hypothetical protein
MVKKKGKYVGWIVSIAFKVDHCPIVPLPVSSIVLGALCKDAQSQGLCVGVPFCNGGWFHDQGILLLHASGMPSTKE